MTESNSTKSALSAAIQIAFGTIILCIVGPLAINMTGYTPITLQSLAVIVVPMAFGMRNGVIAIVLYLLAGAFGLPVFADFKSGWDVFTGPTGGFLIGFIPTGAFAAYLMQRVPVQFVRYFLAVLACHAALLIFGIIGMAISGIAGGEIWGTVKYITPGAFIKSFMGAFLALAIKMKKA